MTADGNYIIDTLPGVRNMFVVGGCNVAGLTTSPAIGEVVATLVHGEEPGVDLSPVRLARFDARSFEELREDAVWRYAAREQWD
jgi:4-methylaminobutanoate oxidase (formaldehyde-forming)